MSWNDDVLPGLEATRSTAGGERFGQKEHRLVDELPPAREVVGSLVTKPRFFGLSVWGPHVHLFFYHFMIHHYSFC